MIPRENVRGKTARKLARRYSLTLNTLSLIHGHTLPQYRRTVMANKHIPPFHPAWYRRKLKGIVDKRVEDDVEW